MLPLISNVVPQQATASQAATSAAAAQSVVQSAQSAAARPLTPVAVSAASAATAYSTQMPERRTVVTQRANTQQTSAAQQSNRAAILPDPDFWKVPNRPAGEPIAPLPSRQQLIQNVQQAAQYTAQATAQEAPVVRQQQPQQQQVLAQRKLQALLAKQPGVGDSSGVGAYTIAAQRGVQMSLPTPVEALA